MFANLRNAALHASALIASALLVATPLTVQAAGSAGLMATLKAPLAAPRQAIIDGVMWSCSGDSCTAADEGGRIQSTCGMVVRRFGQVTSFAAGPRALGAAELERCNKAR